MKRTAWRRMRVAGFVLAALLASPAAPAALRCGGQLVTEGDRPYELLSSCGEPDYREEIPGAYLPGIGVLTAEQHWYYNRGPHQLLRVVRIRDGRIVAVETPGYGFDAAIGGDCRPGSLRIGMSRFELITRCGEPAYRQRRLRVLPSAPQDSPYRTIVPIDEWTYNFGPGSATRVLTIIDGVIRGIDSGHY